LRGTRVLMRRRTALHFLRPQRAGRFGEIWQTALGVQRNIRQRNI